MKIALADHHSFNQRAVARMEPFLNKELSAEEVLVFLVSQFEPIVVVSIKNNVVLIDHPKAW